MDAITIETDTEDPAIVRIYEGLSHHSTVKEGDVKNCWRDTQCNRKPCLVYC